MINAATINKLNEMRFTAMAESYREQLQNASFQALSFEERFSLMADIEWAKRKNNHDSYTILIDREDSMRKRKGIID